MPNRRIIGLVLLIPFSALSLYALATHGYIGLFEYQLQTPAGWQVLADLVIALILVMGWIIKDAKERGMTAWPWIIGTFALGSVTPLLYLIVSHSFAPSSKIATTEQMAT